MLGAGPEDEREGELAPTGSATEPAYAAGGARSVRCGTKCQWVQNLGRLHALIVAGKRKEKREWRGWANARSAVPLPNSP
jgi:hypothetical protein